MSRRSKKVENRVEEIRGQAREVAGKSGEAFKEFADQTGSAAKDFAGKTRDAAREFLESIEKAAQKVEPERHRGRKVLGTLIVLGIGGAIVANDRVRALINDAIGRRDTEPEPWAPRTSDHGNGVATPATGAASEKA